MDDIKNNIISKINNINDIELLEEILDLLQDIIDKNLNQRKICTHCNRILNKNKFENRQGKCINCRKIYSKKYYQEKKKKNV